MRKKYHSIPNAKKDNSKLQHKCFKIFQENQSSMCHVNYISKY